MNQKEILKKLQKLRTLDSLPTLPTVATQLLERLAKENSSVNELADIMELDPSITAQVLKIANSAFYGLRKKIDTVRRALVILGVNEIVNIILSLSLFKTFVSTEGVGFDLKTFWKHSGVVAHLSRFISREFEIGTHGEEYTAGMMHDIGKIILVQEFTDDYQNVIGEIDKTAKDTFSSEVDIIGLDHTRVGKWLSQKWKIPENISNAIFYHHKPAEAEEVILPALVNLADSISCYYGVKQVYNHWLPDFEKNECWDLLKIDKNEINFDEFRQRIKAEIERAVEFMAVLF